MTLKKLIDDGSSLETIAQHLESLDAPSLRRQVLGLGRASQRKLYEMASNDIDVDYFAPANGKGVIHAGRNTLPLPPPFKSFAKVFCQAQGDEKRLFGFNEGPSRPIIGPGYFVGYSTAGNEEWAKRGGLVVDYFQVPDGAVPSGWPKVKPNDSGLQYFVYRHTRDFMRRVSDKVSVGAAYKGEKALDHYFMLLNEA